MRCGSNRIVATGLRKGKGSGTGDLCHSEREYFEGKLGFLPPETQEILKITTFFFIASAQKIKAKARFCLECGAPKTGLRMP